MTFAELEYDSKKRRTRREIFLEKMEGLIPWQQLEDRIEPFYPKAGRGRRPYPLGVMLRVHCVQLFYNLSDPGVESALRGGVSAPLCGSAPERSFAGRDDDPELPPPAGDAGLGNGVVRGDQCASGVSRTLKTGTSSSIIRIRIGIGEPKSSCPHGDELCMGRRGLQGVDKRPENRGCDVAWQVAMKPGKRRLLDPDGAEAAAEKRKASVRAKVEHPFLYVKRRFGYGKVRYRGLAKNTQRILPICSSRR